MIVETHDNKTSDERGTLLGRAGLNGTIEYPYQAEMWVRYLMEERTHRIYVRGSYQVLVVFSKEGPLHQVPEWTGEWQTESTNPYRNIITAFCGPGQQHTPHNFHEAEVWAKEHCCIEGVGTAVVLDQDGILLAYERGPEGPVLTAKGPRPFPYASAA